MSFPKYPEYMDSGVEWLGEVPSHWQVVLSKRFMTVQSGDMISADRETDEGFPIIGGNGFRSFTTEFNTEANTLVIGRVGAQCGCIHHIQEPFWASEHAFRVIEKQCIDKRFFFHTLAALNLNQFAIKTAQPLLNTTIVETQWISVPPLPEQSAIAAFLDRETAKIDALVAEQERLIELLKEKRQAVISHAVTKGLDPNVPIKDSGVEWLGEVPEHWDVVPFTKHVREQIDYRGRTPEKVDECILLVTAKNVKMGHIDYETSQEYIREEEYEIIMRRGIPRINDILFTTEAPLGNVALVDRTNIALAQRIILFRMNETSISNIFILYSMISKFFQDQLKSLSTGSTADGIKASKLHILKVALPPKAEQEVIAVYLSNEEKKASQLIAEAQRGIDLLNERRAALIPAAVTGKIDVRGLADATQ